MTDLVAPPPSTAIEPLPPVCQDLVVLARDPQEMAQAQQGLVVWMDQKLKSLHAELAEAEENLAIAKRMKHRITGWQRQIQVVRKRVVFYEKAKTALEAGYCIVPDFPVQLIAVKTKKHWPPPGRVRGGIHNVPEVKSEPLPQGEGKYVGPAPYASAHKHEDGSTWSQADAFQEVDFPFKIIKPQILSGLEEALRLKLFDEIGVLPAHRANRDPILVGRIKRREGAYNEPTMTFLIAWWIDTRSL